MKHSTVSTISIAMTICITCHGYLPPWRHGALLPFSTTVADFNNNPLTIRRADPEDRDHDIDDFYNHIDLSLEEEPESNNMEAALSRLIEMSTMSSSSSSGNVDFTVLRQPNTQQLETLVARLESLVRDHEGPDALLESSTNDDAPYLDADAYTSYLDKMNMDGSLSTGMGLPMDSLSSQQGLSSLFNPSPLIPNSYYSTNQTASLQDLLQTQPGRPDDVDEELHKQIMSQELGFQQQSEEFLSHLLSKNETTGRDAAYRLREQRRIQEQRQFLEQLDREMQDLENELEETTSRPNASVCSKCGCALTPTEVERSEKICSVCFADQIASSSDMRFLEQPSFRRPYQDSYRMQRPPNQSAGNVSKGQRQNNFVESRRVPVSDDSNQLALKRQVAALQQQVQKYKRQSELAERQVEDLETENHKLRQLVAELEVGIKVEQEQPVQSGPWMQVVDPDTGEVFYWNEETEEMSWEPPE